MNTVTPQAAAALFSAHGLSLPETFYHQLTLYGQHLLQVNAHMNLTAITDPAEVWAKHFLDSALLLKFQPLSLHASVIDVGTGAGFPGLVLAVFRPDLQITLLDSLQKRVDFLEETVRLLGLSNVRCIHARAEEAAREETLRETFDCAMARAVAAMPVLAEYCLPFVRTGGSFCALKGPGVRTEGGAAALAQLGAQPADYTDYEIEYTDTHGVQRIQRCMAVSRKTAPTPPAYPRRGDKIRKKPL